MENLFLKQLADEGSQQAIIEYGRCFENGNW
jgi:hypothetical protein